MGRKQTLSKPITKFMFESPLMANNGRSNIDRNRNLAFRFILKAVLKKEKREQSILLLISNPWLGNAIQSSFAVSSEDRLVCRCPVRNYLYKEYGI